MPYKPVTYQGSGVRDILALNAAQVANRNQLQQNIFQGLGQITGAITDKADQSAEARTGEALAALAGAGNQEQVQGVLGDYTGGQRVDTKALQQAAQARTGDIRAGERLDLSGKQFEETQAQNVLQNKLASDKFAESKSSNAFDKMVKVANYNQEVNKWNSSADVTDGFAKPMELWSGDGEAPVIAESLGGSSGSTSPASSAVSTDTAGSEKPIMMSRKDARAAAVAQVKGQGRSGYDTRQKAVSGIAGDMMVNSAVDNFSPVIQKSIDDFRATNLEFFDDTGKINYDAFQDQDQKIAPGAIDASEKLSGRLELMTKEMNAYLDNFPSGSERDRREREFKAKSGYDELKQMSKDFSGRVKEQQTFERGLKKELGTLGKKIHSGYDGGVDDIYKNNYKDTDYSKNALIKQINSIKEDLPPAFSTVPDGLVAEAIKNVAKSKESFGVNIDNKLQSRNNSSANQEMIDLEIYQEIKNIVNRQNSLSGNGFMPAVANMPRDKQGTESAAMAALREPEAALTKVAGLAGKAKNILNILPSVAGAKAGKAAYNFSNELFEGLKTKKGRDEALQALRGN